MKRAPKGLLLLPLLAATFAFGQGSPTFNTPIKHVILVIQENRTPDNLFQDPVLVANGADIVPPGTPGTVPPPGVGGPCFVKGSDQQVPLLGVPLSSCADPNHGHV